MKQHLPILALLWYLHALVQLVLALTFQYLIAIQLTGANYIVASVLLILSTRIKGKTE